MDMRDILPRRLEGTSLDVPLGALHRIYQRIDTEQTAWIAATPFRCTPGCGSCCEGFEPDLLDVEALYMAAHLARTDEVRLSALASGFGGELQERKGCVLADHSGEHHCTVYGGRPLVCRLFAFSGDRAKDGSARFRLCSRMTAEGPRQLDQESILRQFGVLPPVMGDLAGEAESLLPHRAGERSPLRTALPRAAAKIRFLMDMAE